jgi:hypothetical protein
MLREKYCSLYLTLQLRFGIQKQKTIILLNKIGRILQEKIAKTWVLESWLEIQIIGHPDRFRPLKHLTSLVLISLL